MPYIKQDRRIEALEAQTVGELNYRITMLVKDYVGRKGKNYATLNSVVGVLECVKLELYRRIVAEYEDLAIEMNGDVY